MGVMSGTWINTLLYNPIHQATNTASHNHYTQLASYRVSCLQLNFIKISSHQALSYVLGGEKMGQAITWITYYIIFILVVNIIQEWKGHILCNSIPWLKIRINIYYFFSEVFPVWRDCLDFLRWVNITALELQCTDFTDINCYCYC